MPTNQKGRQSARTGYHVIFKTDNGRIIQGPLDPNGDTAVASCSSKQQ